MQHLSSLPDAEIASQLQTTGVALNIGPYVYKLQSNLPTVQAGICDLYAEFPLAADTEFVDFDVALEQSSLMQRLQSKAEFLFDRQSPFDTIPAQQAFAFLEWGMNWCVSLNVNEYLKLHAAVVARNGHGVVLPGIPGAGKSTLCAALALNGWRVLSDEHALIPPGTTELMPLCRPVSLKNASIEVIRSLSSDAVFGPVSANTHKGVVVHMKADMAADSHDPRPIPARAMVFPRYSVEEQQGLFRRSRATSFVLAAYHSFNYSVLGLEGFNTMSHLLRSIDCFDLVYSDIDWALRAMETVVD